MGFESLKNVFSSAMTGCEGAYRGLCDLFSSAVSCGTGLCRKGTDFVKDVYTGIMEPRAMSAEQRHLDEFKLLAGGAITAVGLATVNPVEMGGGAIPTIEAVHDLEKAGHKWRLHHK